MDSVEELSDDEKDSQGSPKKKNTKFNSAVNTIKFAGKTKTKNNDNGTFSGEQEIGFGKSKTRRMTKLMKRKKSSQGIMEIVNAVPEETEEERAEREYEVKVARKQQVAAANWRILKMQEKNFQRLLDEGFEKLAAGESQMKELFPNKQNQASLMEDSWLQSGPTNLSMISGDPQTLNSAALPKYLQNKSVLSRYDITSLKI